MLGHRVKEFAQVDCKGTGNSKTATTDSNRRKENWTRKVKMHWFVIKQDVLCFVYQTVLSISIPLKLKLSQLPIKESTKLKYYKPLWCKFFLLQLFLFFCSIIFWYVQGLYLMILHLALSIYVYYKHKILPIENY